MPQEIYSRLGETDTHNMEQLQHIHKPDKKNTMKWMSKVEKC